MNEATCPECGSYSIEVNWADGPNGRIMGTVACVACHGTGEKRWDADPHVPDVDGNPIRVGQLVEHVDRYAMGWTTEVHERSFVGVDWGNDTQRLPSDLLRVVTDTFRPSEPDTRDVTLRVTVPSDPRFPSDVVMREVDEALHLFYDRGQGVTVEVVDDGGHDDG